MATLKVAMEHRAASAFPSEKFAVRCNSECTHQVGAMSGIFTIISDEIFMNGFE
jgi:hypothetical protein